MEQSDAVAQIKGAQPALIPREASPFLFLAHPWLDTRETPDIRVIQETRRHEYEAAGFNGAATLQELQSILARDQHLSQCCPTAGHLAQFLDLFFITPCLQLIETRAPEAAINQLLDQFLALTYTQGPFRSVSLSHLFNFDAEADRIDFGPIRVAKLPDSLVARILNEPTPRSFFHPPNAGDFFVVSERQGPCDDVVTWLFEEKDRAERFAQVLQYFKDGVVHVDYTVPHFLPEWVNQVRKWGIYFVGNPRRNAYDNGQHMYRIVDRETESVTRWWRAYNSQAVMERLAQDRNELRQASLRSGEYYELSHTRETPTDRLITLAIALEALFSPQDQGEFTFRISQTVSQLVGSTPEERERVFGEIKDMYNRRSKLFHGQYDLQRFYEGRFVTHGECDRWASIIRQATLRFIVLFLRGENSRQAILDLLTKAALNPEYGTDLRTRSDIEPLLQEMNGNA